MDVIGNYGDVPNDSYQRISQVVRRAAVSRVAYDLWWGRSGIEIFNVLLAIVAVVAIPPSSAAIMGVDFDGSGWVILCLLSLTLAFLFGIGGAIIDRLPKIGQLQHVIYVAGIGLCGGLVWWAIHGGDRAVDRLAREFLVGELGGSVDSSLVRSLAVTVPVASAFYISALVLLDLRWRLAGKRVMADILSRRVNGYPPPILIALNLYLDLLFLIAMNKGVLLRNKGRKVAVAAIRRHRTYVVRDIVRSVHYAGGLRGDIHVYQARALAVSMRVRQHERAIHEIVTVSDVEELLFKLGHEARLLALGEWGEVDIRTRLRLKESFKSTALKIGPGILLAGLAFWLPHLTESVASPEGTAGVQAALFTAAVASLLTFGSRPSNGALDGDLSRRPER
ncbi:hypothetical protein [Plantactinospora sp. BB1]|uniref:hypothetical protein n=1 Tax=Plantactinospora sp. BB1 TaxID=2071627 RepID=UPI00131EF57A|nr:hypothetical protein [Plantactinospora sp. BB1]